MYKNNVSVLPQLRRQVMLVKVKLSRSLVSRVDSCWLLLGHNSLGYDIR